MIAFGNGNEGYENVYSKLMKYTKNTTKINGRKNKNITKYESKTLVQQ